MDSRRPPPFSAWFDHWGDLSVGWKVMHACRTIRMAGTVLPVHPEVERLSAGKYLLVTTYRKDGTAVSTPVWVVRDGDQLAVWTPTLSYKVKRIRTNPRVRLAPCDFRGHPTGDEVTGTARILDTAGSKRIRRLISRRYGIVGRLSVLGSVLRRGQDGTVGITLTLDSAP